MFIPKWVVLIAHGATHFYIHNKLKGKIMTELQEETIQINYHIMKEYLERHYPNTKDSLYRNFCTNYSDFIKNIGDIDLYTISELFQYFVNKTLKNDCDIVEGR